MSLYILFLQFVDLLGSQRPFIRQLIQQLRAVDLVDQQFAITMDPTLTNDAVPRLQADAAEHNCTLEVTEHTSLFMCI